MKILKDFSFKKTSDILPYNGRICLKNINFKYCDFSGFDFSFSKIENCAFSHCIFVGALINWSVLFENCIFSLCDFSHTNFFSCAKSSINSVNSCVFFKCEYKSISLFKKLLPPERFVIEKYSNANIDRNFKISTFIISNRFTLKNNVFDIC